MGIIENIGLYESEKEPQLKLFLDMDGCICDWDRAFRELGDEVTKGLTGQEYEDKYGRDAIWDVISNVGKLEFWSQISWMPDGKKLWNYVKKFNPTILTTPAKNKFSKDGKKIWISRELGDNIPYIFEKDKWKHADTESVLIDDYDKKIKDWINLGDGIGIHHTSADKTIEELKKYGF